MQFVRSVCIAAGAVLVAFWASPQALAAGISFTCGDAGSVNEAAFDAYASGDTNNQGFSGSLCSTIQTVVGGAYASLFTNANASIFIEFTNTPRSLGASTSGGGNYVTYSQYRAALYSSSSGDAVDTGATASLPVTIPDVYPSGTGATPYPADVSLTSALAQALGLSGSLISGANSGVEADGSTACAIGNAGCYNGFIELGSPAELQSSFAQGYYYGTGTQQGNQYDIYSVVEHETDEILGTASCIAETKGQLADTCGVTYTNNGQAVGTVPGVSAVDLFRYSGTGIRAAYPSLDVAYFSYDGGLSPLAYYNHAADGKDYADFNTEMSETSGPFYNCTYVQDAQGCLGGAPLITNDGGAEATILDAVGFSETSASPEPTTLAMLGLGVAFLAAARLRRRR